MKEAKEVYNQKSIYLYTEFNPLNLAEIKAQKNLMVAVVIPTLNEEKTVGGLIGMIQQHLMTPKCPLVDEILVVDSGSTDGTKTEVEQRGVPFFFAGDILSEIPPVRGKGENIWRSLAATDANLCVYIDADPQNPHPGYIYGLLGPLIMHDDLVLAKSFFIRKTRGGEEEKEMQEGGRVTELTIRPIFNLLFPELASIIQPSNGNVAVRRKILMELAFPTHYGVDLSLLIDIAMRWGSNRIAQVFCGEFQQKGQSLRKLGIMAFQALRIILMKAEEYGRISLLQSDLPDILQQPLINSNGEVVWETYELNETMRPPMKNVIYS